MWKPAHELGVGNGEPAGYASSTIEPSHALQSGLWPLGGLWISVAIVD